MIPIKVFVSGKFAEKPLIRSKMDELEKLGYKITHDWTSYEKTPSNKDESKLAAIFDIEGIQKCDIHVVVISDKDYPYRGTFCEMGCSMGLNKRILLWNPFDDAACMTVPFYNHPCVTHFKTWEELVVELDKIKQQKNKVHNMILDSHQMDFFDEYDT
ncbi:nucleoside 2-deoxyribosyltransferase [Fadolivirus algeromassiliense]|jgi:nucleoside 2-deoxyribosyltransferase|uniref:Nucleoside 2-deoxyribosyltransferase n=1 Tax=Fadolivirus FV1/VV64 TaxID=3070911 RepID=A0A7D3QUR8_9VIRU|nr:nucleoside 2-deoxyribosyltransferase [Fadolivirus algeromassiliense]QKF94363.1 nucleoside 2-deoxyribosyltransferase [Fadolivirus FV1/VV64]